MSRKRKHDQFHDEEAVSSVKPHSEGNASTTVSASSAKSKGQLRQEKSERRAKKHKTAKDQQAKPVLPTSSAPSATTSTAPATVNGLTSEPRTQKKEKKKAKKQKHSGLEEGTVNAPEPELEVESRKEVSGKRTQDEAGDKKATPVRFIVFVGNLPYDVTVEQLKTHFVKIAPSSIRISTNKATGKGKGFGFLEFDNYDKMKTCLKLYHHSIFDPEVREKRKAVDTDAVEEDISGKKSTGRRINVELTAGGGGKSKERRAKIKSKNQKLEEERERRRIKEKAEREQAGAKPKGPTETSANAIEVKDRRGAIHPSRLSRVNH
jgi:nucleolar protein 6